jgi:DNA primase
VARIPDHVIASVRERADIVQVVGRYVTLRKAGPRHWGLCPFHSEKTASFTVHEDKQIFHCFGCGVGGDVFSFRCRHDGFDFPDAVRAIAHEVGIEIPEAGSEGGVSLAPLYRANELAVEFFERVLRSDSGAAARSYLKERGLRGELAKHFRVGVAPDRWDGLVDHIRHARASLEVAVRAGLVAPRRDGDGHYDRFRDRVVFPIVEPSGRVVGFGGRDLGNGEPKYLNTSETPIYRKGRVLFGLPQALESIRSKGRVIVVEGYFDVLALHAAGLEEAVAPCGTALTRDHAERLRRYAGEVVLLFDGDDAGRQAAERALPLLLAAGLRVRAVFLPPGEDPDTLLQRKGAEALRDCVDSAVPLLDHLIDREIGSAGRHAWGAADAARALAPLLRAIADPIERDRHLHAIATRLDLRRGALEDALQQYAAREQSSDTPDPSLGHIEMEADLDPVSRALLSAVVGHPDLASVIGPQPLERLPSRDGRDLLVELIRCAVESGEAAVARLCSEDSAVLRPALKAALRRIAMQDRADRSDALQAVRDCLARLEDRALEQELRDLRGRIETTSDPAEREQLLEGVQSALERRRLLTPLVA